MNRIVLSALLCPLLGIAAQAQAPSAGYGSTSAPIMAGAYAPLPTDSPLVQEAEQFVQSRMLSMTFGEVSVAYVQVVAGLNIKMVCSVMEDGEQSSWRFVAFRSLDGRWHLGLAERL